VRDLGISPDAAKSFTWGTPTFSGDADWTKRVGDDCEVDE
jgi:hypothetical protein